MAARCRFRGRTVTRRDLERLAQGMLYPRRGLPRADQVLAAQAVARLPCSAAQMARRHKPTARRVLRWLTSDEFTRVAWYASMAFMHDHKYDVSEALGVVLGERFRGVRSDTRSRLIADLNQEVYEVMLKASYECAGGAAVDPEWLGLLDLSYFDFWSRGRL